MDIAVTTYYLTADPEDANSRFLHTEGCQVRPHNAEGMTKIGDFPDCHSALDEARKTEPRVNGCALCCPQCHLSRSAQQ